MSIYSSRAMLILAPALSNNVSASFLLLMLTMSISPDGLTSAKDAAKMLSLLLRFLVTFFWFLIVLCIIARRYSVNLCSKLPVVIFPVAVVVCPVAAFLRSVLLAISPSWSGAIHQQWIGLPCAYLHSSLIHQNRQKLFENISTSDSSFSDLSKRI